jgi:hypothetical protein
MSSATPMGTVGAMARMRRSSSPSPSSKLLRHHRAMQVQQHGVAALRHGVADAAGDVLEGGVFHRPARPGAGSDRQRVGGAGLLGEFDEGRQRRAGAAVGGDRRLAFGRQPAAGGESRQRRRYRRVGVGLMLHLCDDELHRGPPAVDGA